MKIHSGRAPWLRFQLQLYVVAAEVDVTALLACETNKRWK